MAAAASGCYPLIWPRAGAVLKLAEDWMNSNQPLSAMDAQPVYIRNQVAQKPSTG